MQQPRLGQLLIEGGWLDEARLRRGLEEQKRTGGKLGEVLVRLGLLSEERLTEVLAGQLHLPLAHLETLPPIAPEVLARIPASIARELQVLPLELLEGGQALALAVGEPLRPHLLERLRELARAWIVPRLAGPRALSSAIDRCFGATASATPAPARSELPAAGPKSKPPPGLRQLDAVLELLVEKGFITREELWAKLGQDSPPRPTTMEKRT